MTLYWNRDRSILVLCIAIALIIWFLNELNQSSRDTYDIRIEYILPEGKIHNPHPPAAVQAQIEGKGWDFFSVVFKGRPKSISIIVPDLPNHFISNSHVKDHIQNQILSSQLNVERVSYTDARFQLEEKVSKVVSINTNLETTMAEGYKLLSIGVVPDSVLISGPKSLMNSITQYSTEALILNDISKSEEGVLSLVVPTNPLLEIAESEITYSIIIDQLTQKRLRIPIKTSSLPENATIFPKTVEVVFLAGLSQFDEISERDFTFELGDVASTHTDARSIPILLISYPAVDKIQYSPKSVELIYEKVNN